MTRITTNSRKSRKKFVKLASGYHGRRKRCYTIAKRAYQKSMMYKFVGYKDRKSDYRKLFISIIGAACKKLGSSYSRFIHLFNKHEYSKIFDRKTLSMLAQYRFTEFSTLFDKIMSYHE